MEDTERHAVSQTDKEGYRQRTNQSRRLFHRDGKRCTQAATTSWVTDILIQGVITKQEIYGKVEAAVLVYSSHIQVTEATGELSKIIRQQRFKKTPQKVIKKHSQKSELCLHFKCGGGTPHRGRCWTQTPRTDSKFNTELFSLFFLRGF